MRAFLWVTYILLGLFLVCYGYGLYGNLLQAHGSKEYTVQFFLNLGYMFFILSVSLGRCFLDALTTSGAFGQGGVFQGRLVRRRLWSGSVFERSRLLGRRRLGVEGAC